MLAGGVAAADGGFFPESWSWVAVGTLFVATLLLIVRPRTSLRALDLVFLGGLVLYGGWIALSTLWSTTTPGAIDDGWRMLAYVGAVGLCLLVLERRTVPQLLGGVLAGVVLVAGYALLTRLLPDRFGGLENLSTLRLSDPVGYWNGLAIYSAMGTLLALGFAARARHPLARGLSAALPVVLLTAMYFTFSRGAWIALGIGLTAAVAVDARRLQLVLTGLVIAPWAALALVFAARADALSTQGASLDNAVDQGGNLLALVAVFALAAAACGGGLALAGRRVAVGAGVRAGFAGALVLLALAGAGTIWAEYGSPWSLAERGWNQFRASPKSTGADVSGRLFDLSSNGRVDLWTVAWGDFESNPLAGKGASSFEQSWYERRPDTAVARDAHSLYLETLAELGLVGGVLLALALGTPLVAFVRARRSPRVVGAFAAYVAFLAHAGVDWDWELAGVTLVALLAGCALVARARPDDPPRELPRALKVAAPAAAALLALVAVVSVMSTVPLGKAREAALVTDWATAEREARRAQDWAPWSSDAWRLLGEAQLGQGRVAAARKSFRQAAAKDPGKWLLHLELAITSTGAEQRRAIAAASRLNPRDDQVELVRDSLAGS